MLKAAIRRNIKNRFVEFETLYVTLNRTDQKKRTIKIRGLELNKIQAKINILHKKGHPINKFYQPKSSIKSTLEI